MSKIFDELDLIFSEYVRRRDGRCVFCEWRGEGWQDLQCMHFFGRGHEGTRFDLDNCDAGCNRCHRYFEQHRDQYIEFKLKQLGPSRLHRITELSKATILFKNRVRKEMLATWRKLLRQLKEQQSFQPGYGKPSA